MSSHFCAQDADAHYGNVSDPLILSNNSRQRRILGQTGVPNHVDHGEQGYQKRTTTNWRTCGISTEEPGSYQFTTGDYWG